MKIGILTYHRAENYGALLQAYALKTYLEYLGYNVEFVDYWPEYHSEFYNLFSYNTFRKRNIKGKLYYLFVYVVRFFSKVTRKKKLQRFMHQYLGLSKCPLYTETSCKTERYDAVIYGSDQIWRKQHLGGVEFDSWYFGSDNIIADRKIVYAGSMGSIANNSEDEDYLKKMMNNFDSISVRERDLQDYLGKFDVCSTLVNDPVFLLSKEEWRRIEEKPKNKGKYIVFYNLLLTKVSESFALELSKKTGLPLYEINYKSLFPRHGVNLVRAASIEQFVGLIDNAEYVVSNSFHGVALSLILEKQFFAVGFGKRANRVVSLLNRLDIIDRYSECGVGNLDFRPINYQDVKKRIDAFVSQSVNYLNISLHQN